MAEKSEWTIHAAGEAPATMAHVGYLSAAILSQRRWVLDHPTAGGLCLTAGLWLLWRARRRVPEGRRLAARAGADAMFACAVIILSAGHYELLPGTLDHLLELERMTELTEAEALRLGRWPTEAEWKERVGAKARDGQDAFTYSIYDRATTPWDAYGLLPNRVLVTLQNTFGPDGLFGTPDDTEDWLAPEQYGRASWPHGRAPRHPNFRIPPTPRPSAP